MKPQNEKKGCAAGMLATYEERRGKKRIMPYCRFRLTTLQTSEEQQGRPPLYAVVAVKSASCLQGACMHFMKQRKSA